MELNLAYKLAASICATPLTALCRCRRRAVASRALVLNVQPTTVKLGHPRSGTHDDPIDTPTARKVRQRGARGGGTSPRAASGRTPDARAKARARAVVARTATAAAPAASPTPTPPSKLLQRYLASEATKMPDASASGGTALEAEVRARTRALELEVARADGARGRPCRRRERAHDVPRAAARAQRR